MHVRTLAPAALAFLIPLAFAACGDDEPGKGGGADAADAASPDAAPIADAGAPDARREDAAQPDANDAAAEEDARVEDADTPDVDTSDVDTSDVDTSDIDTSDANTADASMSDAGNGGCGLLGTSCTGGGACDSISECADPPGVCIPSVTRPGCGGFAGAQCPAAFPVCMFYSGSDYGPCFTADEATCVCAQAAGQIAFGAC